MTQDSFNPTFRSNLLVVAYIVTNAKRSDNAALEEEQVRSDRGR